MWAELISLLAVAVILSLSVVYIVRRKKKGGGCIGCPYASSCKSKCHCKEDSEKQ